MSFILVIWVMGLVVIDIALNLYVSKLLKEITESNKEQTCTWTINFGNGELVSEKQKNNKKKGQNK